MAHLIAKIAQFVFWITGRWVFMFFLRVEFRGEYNLLKLKKPFVIAANHTSALDPILVASIFPFNSKISPVRFAVWHKYYWSPLIHPFARVMGSFPVQKRIGLANTLKVGLKALQDKGVVGIFPEGKRVHIGHPRKGRRGAAYLSMRTGASLLPVFIKGVQGLKAVDFFSRKKKVVIYIGEMFDLPSYLKDFNNVPQLNEASNIIMSRIRELPHIYNIHGKRHTLKGNPAFLYKARVR